MKISIKRGYIWQTRIIFAYIMLAESSPGSFRGKTCFSIRSVGLAGTFEISLGGERYGCCRKGNASILEGN